LKKAYGSFISNRIQLELGLIIPEVYVHQFSFNLMSHF